jgi:predicted O-methyltransferase YrrM
MAPIHLRNIPPPSETFDHVGFLTMMAQWIKPERYLELGVGDLKCFKSISVISKESIAVDLNPIAMKPAKGITMFEGCTDKYIELIKGSGLLFDMAFIDADHGHEQSLKDFNNAQEFLLEDGFIFLHDTYPFNEGMLSPDLCNDAYKTPLWIKQNKRDQFELVSLPFNPGLTIVKKMNGNKQLAYK